MTHLHLKTNTGNIPNAFHENVLPPSMEQSPKQQSPKDTPAAVKFTFNEPKAKKQETK